MKIEILNEEYSKSNINNYIKFLEKFIKEENRYQKVKSLLNSDFKNYPIMYILINQDKKLLEIFEKKNIDIDDIKGIITEMSRIIFFEFYDDYSEINDNDGQISSKSNLKDFSKIKDFANDLISILINYKALNIFSIDYYHLLDKYEAKEVQEKKLYFLNNSYISNYSDSKQYLKIMIENKIDNKKVVYEILDNLLVHPFKNAKSIIDYYNLSEENIKRLAHYSTNKNNYYAKLIYGDYLCSKGEYDEGYKDFKHIDFEHDKIFNLIKLFYDIKSDALKTQREYIENYNFDTRKSFFNEFTVFDDINQPLSAFYYVFFQLRNGKNDYMTRVTKLMKDGYFLIQWDKYLNYQDDYFSKPFEDDDRVSKMNYISEFMELFKEKNKKITNEYLLDSKFSNSIYCFSIYEKAYHSDHKLYGLSVLQVLYDSLKDDKYDINQFVNSLTVDYRKSIKKYNLSLEPYEDYKLENINKSYFSKVLLYFVELSLIKDVNIQYESDDIFECEIKNFLEYNEEFGDSLIERLLKIDTENTNLKNILQKYQCTNKNEILEKFDNLILSEKTINDDIINKIDNLVEELLEKIITKINSNHLILIKRSFRNYCFNGLVSKLNEDCSDIVIPIIKAFEYMTKEYLFYGILNYAVYTKQVFTYERDFTMGSVYFYIGENYNLYEQYFEFIRNNIYPDTVKGWIFDINAKIKKLLIYRNKTAHASAIQIEEAKNVINSLIEVTGLIYMLNDFIDLEKYSKIEKKIKKDSDINNYNKFCIKRKNGNNKRP